MNCFDFIKWIFGLIGGCFLVWAAATNHEVALISSFILGMVGAGQIGKIYRYYLARNFITKQRLPICKKGVCDWRKYGVLKLTDKSLPVFICQCGDAYVIDDGVLCYLANNLEKRPYMMRASDGQWSDVTVKGLVQ
jgi:hypothetical protein